MKSKTTIVLITALSLIFAVNAQAAARWDSFAAAADCDGWSMEGGVKIGSSHPFIDLTYDVTLSQDGEAVERHEGFMRIWMTADVVPISKDMIWETASDGTGVYDVEGYFVVPFTGDGDSLRYFSQTIDCGGGEPVCAQRPGWWRRHPGEWPVESLVVAGVEYAKEDLVAFLHMRPRPLRVRLARQLIAAKLNVAAGVENTIQETIDSADQFLIEHPFGTSMDRQARREARQLKRALRTFNRQGCPGKAMPVATAMDDEDWEDGDDLYEWGEVKSMYR